MTNVRHPRLLLGAVALWLGFGAVFLAGPWLSTPNEPDPDWTYHDDLMALRSIPTVVPRDSTRVDQGLWSSASSPPSSSWLR